jgi:hypothetical protein
MSDDFPVLDDAMMGALVDDYEAKEQLPGLDNDPDLPSVPSPPQETYDLPGFDEGVMPMGVPLEDGFLQMDVPKETPLEVEEQPMGIQQANEEIEVVQPSDVKDLAMLENVFDKRITERDVERELTAETRNDSGRLIDKEDVEVKTELNDQEILSISKLRFIAERYDVPVLNEFTDNLMTLKISRKRKGRQEFIQGLHADERREQPNEGFFSKLFGGRKE